MLTYELWSMFWFVIFFVSLSFFFIYHYHYLFLLIGLEFLLLSIFYGISMNLYFINFFGLLTFLVLLVCMGGFGLSLLVFLVRSIGFDFFLFF